MRGFKFFIGMMLFGVIVAIGCQDADPDQSTDTTTEADERVDQIADLQMDRTAANGSLADRSVDYVPEFEMSDEVRQFAETALSHGMMQILMAEIVIDTADDAEVRQFAQSVRRDHTDATAELQKIVRGAGWEIPVALQAAHQSTVQELQDAPIANVEQEYLDLVVNTHRKSIEKFDACQDHALAARFESWVQATIPMLRDNMKSGQQLMEQSAMVK